jgi:hypothetical protein
MDLPSDLIDLLAEFDATKVDYVLVGGLAVALHGFPRFTKDADLWLRDTPENLERVRRALVAFGAPASTIEALGPAQPLDVVWLGKPPSRIDLMKGVPGGDFERAWGSRVLIRCVGVETSVVGREELIRLKRASGRPQDLLDAAQLEALDPRS